MLLLCLPIQQPSALTIFAPQRTRSLWSSTARHLSHHAPGVSGLQRAFILATRAPSQTCPGMASLSASNFTLAAFAVSTICAHNASSVSGCRKSSHITHARPPDLMRLSGSSPSSLVVRLARVLSHNLACTPVLILYSDAHATRCCLKQPCPACLE